MRSSDLLAELRSRDIQIWADGDRLRCNAPDGVLTLELRDRLQQHKTEILEFLRTADTLARQQRAIVPLQPQGERIPVFAVAGHNGDVFCYRALAQHLGDDQPFYGLQPPGLDDHSEPLTRIEDLAAYFAEQIQAFQPNGACIIAGYCAGGSIAFELARQLEQQRAPIHHLALFGSPYPTLYRPLKQLRLRINHHVERVVRHGRVLAKLSFAEQRSYITERLRNWKAQQSAELPTAPDSVLILRAKVIKATLAAARRYTPGHFAGHVNLLLPCREWVHSACEPLKWKSVAQHTEAYFGPDGCNTDIMLREPHAQTFAELFKQSCAQASGFEKESLIPHTTWNGERQSSHIATCRG